MLFPNIELTTTNLGKRFLTYLKRHADVNGYVEFNFDKAAKSIGTHRQQLYTLWARMKYTPLLIDYGILYRDHPKSNFPLRVGCWGYVNFDYPVKVVGYGALLGTQALVSDEKRAEVVAMEQWITTLAPADIPKHDWKYKAVGLTGNSYYAARRDAVLLGELPPPHNKGKGGGYCAFF